MAAATAMLSRLSHVTVPRTPLHMAHSVYVCELGTNRCRMLECNNNHNNNGMPHAVCNQYIIEELTRLTQPFRPHRQGGAPLTV
jgi:hypothetical protein